MTKTLRLILISLGAVIIPAISFAQVTYTLANVPQADDDDLALLITARNERLCNQLAAVGGFSCTQAQACTAAVLKGYVVTNGASCTAANARQATLGGVVSSVRIWPNTSVSDRNEYVLFRIASPAFIDQKPFITGWNQIRSCILWQTQNTTQRNAACAAHGLPNLCSLYPTYVAPATCPGA